MTAAPAQHFVGLISGTSVDGVDACIAAFEPDGRFAGLPAFQTYPYPEALRAQLLKLGQREHAPTLQDLAKVDHAVGRAFASAAVQILDRADLRPDDIVAVGSHGQTLFHGPDADTRNTLQIGDANLIAAQLGVPVVADFRRADMAVGGQGAPLAPALHAALWHGQSSCAIVNLGGIANVTLLPATTEAVTAFDTGPANALLDAWAELHLGEPVDIDGAFAASGAVDEVLLQTLLGDPYFAAAPPKSTGRETFNLAWLRERMDGRHALSPKDVQATLLALSAQTVGTAIRSNLPDCQACYVCGGGTHNPVLMNALRDALPTARWETTEALGVAPDAVEALAFAWLAMRRMQGLPGNLPTVTGAARAVQLGAIYDI